MRGMPCFDCVPVLAGTAVALHARSGTMLRMELRCTWLLSQRIMCSLPCSCCLLSSSLAFSRCRSSCHQHQPLHNTVQSACSQSASWHIVHM